MRIFDRLAVLAHVMLAVGCAGTPVTPVHTYKGEILPDHELATLIGKYHGYIASIDNNKYDWREGKTHFKLLPGRHEIVFITKVYKGATADAHLSLDMRAGRTYRITKDSGGFLDAYDTVMVIDEETKKIIAEQTFYEATEIYGGHNKLLELMAPLQGDDEIFYQALAGSLDARMRMYYLLRDGNPKFTHLKQDRLTRFFFLCRAADNGNAEARYELGRLYELGNDEVPKDLVKALMWYRLSTKGGHDMAVDDIDRLSQIASPDQLEQVETMIRTWKYRACEKELYESKRKENQGD